MMLAVDADEQLMPMMLARLLKHPGHTTTAADAHAASCWVVF